MASSPANFTAGDLYQNGFLIADTITLDYTHTLYSQGNITTTNTPLAFPNPVVLTANNTYSTGTAGGNITFDSTLDGDAPYTRGLTLTANTGNIDFIGAVGSINPLSSLIITSANNVTANAITVGALYQLSGTGTTTFNGPVIVPTTVGIQLIGNNFTINNTVTTLSNGSLAITNTGTLTLAGTLNLSGGFNQNGTGPTTLSGSITAGQSVSFAGPVNLTGNPSINTSSASQNILFSNTVDGSGNLTLTAGGGNITFAQAAGSTTPLGNLTIVSSHDITTQAITASSIDIASSTGTATFNGNLSTSGPAGITINGNNIIRNGSLTTTGGGSVTVTNSGTYTVTGSPTTTTIDGNYTQNGTGPVNFSGTINTINGNITYNSALNLIGPATYNSSAGGGNILFNNTVDGTQPLTLIAGTGNITFSAAVGSVTPLGPITINSATNVTAQQITAASLIQLAGTGTTTLNGIVAASGVGGIQLTGTNIIRNASWTTTGAGPIIVDNSGLFTSTNPSDINAGTSFSQTGTGPVTLSDNINTTNGSISFAGPVTLAGTTTLDSSAGAGNITFTNTLDGDQDLTLTSGAGNITFQNPVGATTPLNDITVTIANNLTFQALAAASLNQINGSGTTTLNGPTTTSGASGIQITGNNVTLAGPLTTNQ